MARKGARGFFLPYYPARPYYDPYYDPLWQRLHRNGRRGLAAPHVRRQTAARPARRSRASTPTTFVPSATVKSYFSSIDHLTDMILTGVFQRFPS